MMGSWLLVRGVVQLRGWKGEISWLLSSLRSESWVLLYALRVIAVGRSQTDETNDRFITLLYS